MIRPAPDFDGPAAGDGGGHVALLGAGDVGVGRNHWLDGRGELGWVGDVAIATDGVGDGRGAGGGNVGVSVAISGHGHSGSASAVVDQDVAVAVLGGGDSGAVVGDSDLAGSVIGENHVGTVLHDMHGAAAVDGGCHIAGLGAGHVGVGAAGVLLQGVSATAALQLVGVGHIAIIIDGAG